MRTVRVKRLDHGKGLPLPARATSSSAGLDLCAAIEEPLTLAPGERAMIPTGFEWEIPDGYEGQVRPRSGLAVKFGVTVLNSPGTVDSDYRGEVKVILCNFGEESFTIERGMRIAQMIVAPVAAFEVVEERKLEETGRGKGGFGHTGGIGR